MARILYGDVDLVDNQLMNVRLHMLYADPDPVEAKFYYNVTSHEVRYYDGTSWVTVGSASEGGTGPAARYVHTQAVLASTWVVNHNLNGHPAVSVEDAAGTVVHGTITYVDGNSLTISFARSCTGRANCS